MAQPGFSPAVLNAVTATTTSVGVNIENYEQVVVQFICASHASGNGVFSIDASNDGTNWITGIAFQDATSANSATFVTSKTLNSNSSQGGIITGGWKMIRVVVAVTTDGAYSALIQAKKLT